MLGMGGSAIALPDDPSVVTINPAGLSLFSRPAISATTRLIYQNNRDTGYLPVSDVNSGIELDQSLISAIVVWKSLRIGTSRDVAINRDMQYTSLQPFHSDGFVISGFPTRRVLQQTRLIDNALSAGLRITSTINLGLTFRLSRLEYLLSEQQYLHNNAPTNSPFPFISKPEIDYFYADFLFEKRQYKAGFSLGLMAKLSSRLVFGAVYHYRPSFKINGSGYLPRYEFKTNVPIIYAAALVPDVNIQWSIPDAFGAGLAYKYRGWLNFSLDVWQVQYSEMANGLNDYLTLDLLVLSPVAINPQIEPIKAEKQLGIHNSWEWHIGMEYIFRFFSNHRRLPLRLGVYQNTSGTFYQPDNHPLGNTFPVKEHINHYTAGLGMLVNQNMRFDGAIEISSRGWVILGTSVYTF
jgi:long-subunit fatty acid transport protein